MPAGVKCERGVLDARVGSECRDASGWAGRSVGAQRSHAEPGAAGAGQQAAAVARDGQRGALAPGKGQVRSRSPGRRDSSAVSRVSADASRVLARTVRRPLAVAAALGDEVGAARSPGAERAQTQRPAGPAPEPDIGAAVAVDCVDAEHVRTPRTSATERTFTPLL